jgi:succinyl-diaminopimelate desuccinylase
MQQLNDMNDITLTQELVRIPSLTNHPDQVRQAIKVCEGVLSNIGFETRIMSFENDDGMVVHNVYANYHGGEPTDHDDPGDFLLCGHVDVVPPGDTNSWHHPPFAGQVDQDNLYGRGAADMKSAVASSMMAAARFIDYTNGRFPGTIHVLIVGDEETGGLYGARPSIQSLMDDGVNFDAAIVGEPSGFDKFADHIKYGGRGVFVGTVSAHATQAHSAHTKPTENPVHAIAELSHRFITNPLDNGNDHMQPSGVQITGLTVNNTAHNVVPGQASATIDIRFTNDHALEDIADYVRHHIRVVNHQMDGVTLGLDHHYGGQAFLSDRPDYLSMVADAVEQNTGYRPKPSTVGGSSDARFIAPHCPVVHVGHLNHTIHKIDEHVTLGDIKKLTDIYTDVLREFYS